MQQAIQAATAAVQGLAGGNIAQAMAGGAAPYLAEVIHKMTEDKTVPGGINVEANLMAHAVLGAVVAQTSGHSAPLLNHFQTDGLASPVYSVDQLLYQYEETGCPPLWYLRHAYATAQRFHPGG
ncbi:hypothetical protein EPYR_03154 [Erwinia pyrifoliae DSM 12163]|nr:hypothetical protein EPYR_03154 [Erwinia pyrifoliae DSM 12163]